MSRFRKDSTIRQHLPKQSSAVCGDFCVFEKEPLEARQSLETLQPGIGDFCVVEAEPFESRQSLEMLQPGVGDFRVVEVEPFEARQSLEMFWPGVGDLRVVEVEIYESRQSLELLQPGVRALRVSDWRLDNPLRCSSPVSVTCVLKIWRSSRLVSDPNSESTSEGTA